MSNPIKNQAQAHSVERYINYLKTKIMHPDAPLADKVASHKEILELTPQLNDFNENVKIRLVVSN